MNNYELFVADEWVDTEEKIEVVNKYTEETFATTAQADEELVKEAVSAANKAVAELELTPYERYEILAKASELVLDNKEDLAQTLCQEVGKTISDARTEAERTAKTLQISAEEAKRIKGEVVPLEATPGSENRRAFTTREPVGVVCAITPFNFPLNLLAHKIGPAIAARNTVVIKPTPETPVTSVKLVKLLLEAGLPKQHVNLLFGGAEVGEYLLENQEIDFYSFTGSVPVGERISEASKLRGCSLELGNNSAVIVHQDVPDIDQAAASTVEDGFANAGQVCISVQRVYVHQDIYEEFVTKLKEEAEKLVVGDPSQEETDMGPLIRKEEAPRIDSWVQEALDEGARLVTGGEKTGDRFYQPTVLADVDQDMKVVKQEIFGPVIAVSPYSEVEEAIARTNDSDYGLQAGIFTSDIQLGLEAAQEIEAGGVIINDTASYRVDAMPYGGVKKSGLGKEGPKYVIEEMTEEKIIVFNN